jgi:ABC-type multidrug transport system ATPase subunit
MDPGARRFMWSLISSTMTGRSVMLTTHSMEECEALCQRIGIMVSGRLKCIGGAQHLRSRYGHGYQLDLNVAIERVDDARQWVTNNFMGSELIEVYERNLKFRIRKGDRSLGAIFRLINENKEVLGITEYSVSEATLEQIFINFARTQEEESLSNDGAPKGFIAVSAAGNGNGGYTNQPNYHTNNRNSNNAPPTAIEVHDLH